MQKENMALGIDMDTGADSPGALMLKEGIKHTVITVVNRGYSHEHSHGTGHLKRRLGIMVMTGPGTRRTSVDNVKAV